MSSESYNPLVPSGAQFSPAPVHIITKKYKKPIRCFACTKFSLTKKSPFALRLPNMISQAAIMLRSYQLLQATTALKPHGFLPTIRHQVPRRQIHNIELLRLHNELHRMDPPPLRLHGLRLHTSAELRSSSVNQVLSIENCSDTSFMSFEGQTCKLEDKTEGKHSQEAKKVSSNSDTAQS